MPIAALYDIHGNLPALDAVLEEVLQSGATRVLVGGDVVPGPMPRACLERLTTLDLPVDYITGNGEREVLAELAGTAPSALPDAVREIIGWTARQVAADFGDLLRTWPGTLQADVDGLGPVLFCHATPHNDSAIFTRRTADEALAPIFREVGVSTVVCGHTHMQFDRRVGGVRVVNAGSVGMPFGDPGAYWLLLGPGVEPRRTAYDLEAAAALVRTTAYPQAEDFAAHNIRNPPSEEAMLGAFRPSEIGAPGGA